MGVIDRYAELLPVTERTPRITLGEGSTPLVHLDGISRMLEIELWAKLEGCNPSGSFKDRGMVMAVAKALEDGQYLTDIGCTDADQQAVEEAYAQLQKMLDEEIASGTFDPKAGEYVEEEE